MQRADEPPLKGEVPVMQAVGFTGEESGNFNLMFPDSYGSREMSRQCRQTFSGRVPENRRNWELVSMGPNFVARIGGSKCVQAQPGKGGLSNVALSAPSSATPQALSPEYSGRPQKSFIGDLRR